MLIILNFYKIRGTSKFHCSRLLKFSFILTSTRFRRSRHPLFYRNIFRLTIWFNLILSTLCSLRCNRSPSLFYMIKLLRFIFSWIINIVLNQRWIRLIRSVNTLLFTFYIQIFCFRFTIFIKIIIYRINQLLIGVPLFDIFIIITLNSLIVVLNSV